MEKRVDGNANWLRILTIAAYYPPSSAAAAIRARNIVRNLEELRHDVNVITARIYEDHDDDVPLRAQPVGWLDFEEFAKRALRRSATRDGAPVPPKSWQRGLRTLASRLIVPDLRAPWIPPATLAARRAIASADVVLSTGGASAHAVAALVRRGRPWLADINDLWWRVSRRDTGPLRQKIDFSIERRVIAGPDILIVPVAAQGTEINRRWGRSSVTVFTGFDGDEFDLPRDTPRGDVREIIYAGTLYSDFRLDLLFDGLATVRDRDGLTPDSLRIVFIGSGAGIALEQAAAQGVDAFVDGLAPIPRPQLLERLVRADALLMPLLESDPHHLPMRFFDFVGSRRPLVGVGSPAHPAGQLIRKHGLGSICATAQELASVLTEIVQSPRAPDLSVRARQPFAVEGSRRTLEQALQEAVALARPPRTGRAEPDVVGGSRPTVPTHQEPLGGWQRGHEPPRD